MENRDSNSRLVVDEDDNDKFRLERVLGFHVALTLFLLMTPICPLKYFTLTICFDYILYFLHACCSLQLIAADLFSFELLIWERIVPCYSTYFVFVRKYLPILKGYPNQYIYEPWTAPEHVQKAAKCIIGKDYPLPMVNHVEASQLNMERMKQIYLQLYRELKCRSK